jgi:hypothetical protein
LPLNAPSGNIGVNLAGYILAWSPTQLAGDVEKHFLCKNKITMQNSKIKILLEAQHAKVRYHMKQIGRN